MRDVSPINFIDHRNRGGIGSGLGFRVRRSRVALGLVTESRTQKKTKPFHAAGRCLHERAAVCAGRRRRGSGRAHGDVRGEAAPREAAELRHRRLACSNRAGPRLPVWRLALRTDVAAQGEHGRRPGDDGERDEVARDLRFNASASPPPTILPWSMRPGDRESSASRIVSGNEDGHALSRSFRFVPDAGAGRGSRAGCRLGGKRSAAFFFLG